MVRDDFTGDNTICSSTTIFCCSSSSCWWDDVCCTSIFMTPIVLLAKVAKIVLWSLEWKGWKCVWLFQWNITDSYLPLFHRAKVNSNRLLNSMAILGIASIVVHTPQNPSSLKQSPLRNNCSYLTSNTVLITWNTYRQWKGLQAWFFHCLRLIALSQMCLFANSSSYLCPPLCSSFFFHWQCKV